MSIPRPEKSTMLDAETRVRLEDLLTVADYFDAEPALREKDFPRMASMLLRKAHALFHTYSSRIVQLEAEVIEATKKYETTLQAERDTYKQIAENHTLLLGTLNAENTRLRFDREALGKEHVGSFYRKGGRVWYLRRNNGGPDYSSLDAALEALWFAHQQEHGNAD